MFLVIDKIKVLLYCSFYLFYRYQRYWKSNLNQFYNNGRGQKRVTYLAICCVDEFVRVIIERKIERKVGREKLRKAFCDQIKQKFKVSL